MFARNRFHGFRAVERAFALHALKAKAVPAAAKAPAAIAAAAAMALELAGWPCELGEGC